MRNFVGGKLNIANKAKKYAKPIAEDREISGCMALVLNAGVA